ncbi:MAG: sigma-70 family RNA polymerase sigma factor [Labilithrix sp.]|nr:sigma-70 family RNA polymerase sigma factor [Labilithrix sp.]
MRLARLRLPADQAADAAQSMLMKVFARASDFEAGKPVLPWFYAVAANELRTLMRQRARAERRSAGESAAHALAAGDDPERALLDRELHDALAQAIAALDEEGAEAIAAMLDEGSRPAIGPAAFRKRVSRAYAKIRVLLGGLDAK